MKQRIPCSQLGICPCVTWTRRDRGRGRGKELAFEENVLMHSMYEQNLQILPVAYMQKMSRWIANGSSPRLCVLSRLQRHSLSQREALVDDSRVACMQNMSQWIANGSAPGLFELTRLQRHSHSSVLPFPSSANDVPDFHRSCSDSKIPMLQTFPGTLLWPANLLPYWKR